MKLLKWIIGLGLIGFCIAFFGAKLLPSVIQPLSENDQQVNVNDPALVEKGAYLAKVADCVACHTAPGGDSFAGGLGMQTPMGTIYSTNITPDPETGIGDYTLAEFDRAVRGGIRKDGQPLYPAMPYVSYQVVTDAEVEAMYAYFMSGVDAVEQVNPDTTIPWPANARWPLAWWQLLFAPEREFKKDASLTAEQNHGAYLVEGLAHCGACHTPRGIGFQELALSNDESGEFLSGSVLEGWYAKSLRDEGIGLSTWTEQDIKEFLKTGRTDKTAAFGSMADVVEHSTQYFTDGDLEAIASYLKSLPPKPGNSAEWEPKEDTTTAALRSGDFSERGALLYVDHCAACHRLDGMGAPRIFPALKGNSIVFAEDPSSLIQVTMAGSDMADTPADRMTFTMPGFYHLSNQDLADVLNYIRNGWGNHGSEITTRDIAWMRRVVDHAPMHYVPDEENPSSPFKKSATLQHEE